MAKYGYSLWTKEDKLIDGRIDLAPGSTELEVIEAVEALYPGCQVTDTWLDRRSMFTSKVSFVIGLNARGVPYPESLALGVTTEELAVHGIDGFSVNRGLGFWKGEPEDTLTVSVLVGDDSDFPVYAERIAQVLAVRLDQECVLWAVEPLNGGLSFAAHNDNFKASSSATKVAA